MPRHDRRLSRRPHPRPGHRPSDPQRRAGAARRPRRRPRRPEQLAQQVLRLTGRVDLLAADAACCEADRKLAEHLRVERDALPTFLVVPGVQATNWRAEQQIRPIVVNREHWGGDRTREGADTLQVLASLLRSARQQDRDPVGILVPLLASPVPIVAGLAVPGRGHPRRDHPGLIVPGRGDPAQPRAA
ncbi:MAG: IS66 family transposase [Egibacteraceae bacterium]